MDGGAGDDIVMLDEANDFFFWVEGTIGSGDDVVYGGSGHDILHGGRDDDTLHGGPGDDTTTGGEGDDVLTGHDGADRFYHFENGGSDVITDFDVREDALHLGSAHDPFYVWPDDDGLRFDLGDGIEVIFLGLTDDFDIGRLFSDLV